VQLPSVFTWLAGAISLAECKKQEMEISQRHAAVDSRDHARFIMTITSTTHLMSSILLFPVYSLLATRKLVSCSVSDAITVFTSVFSGSEASVKLFFGSKRLDQVAVCVRSMSWFCQKAGATRRRTCRTQYCHWDCKLDHWNTVTCRAHASTGRRGDN